VLGQIPSHVAIGPALYAAVVAVTCLALGAMGLLAYRQGTLVTGQPTLISIRPAFWDGSATLYAWLILAIVSRIAGGIAVRVRDRRRLREEA
jgi:hypothetical protein